MPRIRLLDDPLINRIAAGEVVERPASVVKELVENSLDAGAGRVEILVEGGGRRLIRVTDDGDGMDAQDARMAVERHATSKLRGTEDLERIRTLGFRGEALASIAAVSRFCLRTAARDGEGSEVSVAGGEEITVTQAGLPRGTSVSVERLFYNMPARRKFLRTESTELSHIVRQVTRAALAHPAVRFLLATERRRLIDVAHAADLAQRVEQLLGADFAGKLLPFDRSAYGIRAHGLAGRPVDALTRRDAQHVFVNGRAVQDRTLNHALLQAYENNVPRGRYPAAVLFVELPPDQVDVNVHPQKAEVRFRESGAVHGVVRAAVASAFGQPQGVPTLGELRPRAIDPAAPTAGPAAAALRFLEVREQAGGGSGDGAGYRAVPERAAGQAALAEEPPVAHALGQFEDSYIVAVDADGLLLIDQHAAHERVLFERYLDDAKENRVERQRLMFPCTVELSAEQQVRMSDSADEFRRLGFGLEPFGDRTWRVDAVPAVAAELDAERLLLDWLAEAATLPSAAAGDPDLRRKLVTSAACQAAIKIHHPLELQGMRGLLADLALTRNPTTCPHGRPVSFRLTRDEIERAFRRR